LQHQSLPITNENPIIPAIYTLSLHDALPICQNGRRFKEDGEPMFTLTSQDRHGVAILKSSRTEYGKKVRKDYEDGKIKESRHNIDRKSTRLNSSHVSISYAVFCLKKKK